ncbi:hypothetical protein BLL37_06300 [Pseudomonas azotoformans]|uniref:Kinase OspG kinase domain-containing protein n=1 Tax=Pseudomonas azotoformans TaxID=47878 RepID=A0A1V2JCJ6_PSEAZ|nr:hypothetical protein BFL39_28670 [Pseudomonas azotoformans]ONH43107.1 hypothetical protein BLL37_21745 [Pseudomonas azotoformans]ONH46474.1 hypothetical protein BLL37_06300 [Pseudomonas azotoformans]
MNTPLPVVASPSETAPAGPAPAPVLGNFGGALSWPVPLTESQRQAILDLMPDSRKGVLGYLLSGSAVANADLQNPPLALQKLLASPKAQALWQVIQSELGGLPTDASSNDYVMAAIHLGLDPQNSIDGFIQRQSRYWGQPASVVIEGVGAHLVEQGRATPQTATFAAHLLLAARAPEFLVKDIPANVTYGSLIWAQLAMATARVEAASPGATRSMSYAEVLAKAGQTGSDGLHTQHVQRKALTDWAVANGVLDATSTLTDSDLEHAREAYNGQLSALMKASAAVQTEIPSRRAMALARLQECFPGVDPSVFEIRNIQKAWLRPGRPGLFPGMRSMLDIVMEGAPPGHQEHWISKDPRIPVKRFCQLYEGGAFKVAEAFKSQYDLAIQSLENGHKGLASYLVSTLPLEDRNNFKHGKLEFFHTNEYTMATDFLTPLALKTRGHTLHVKTTRGREVNVYEIDTRSGTIQKQNHLRGRYTEPYTARNMESRTANVVSKTVLFDTLSAEQGASGNRFDAIGDVFARSLDLKNEDVLAYARGVTSYDENRATNHAIGEFFLNLIPFRSAIVNFIKGNYGEGALDLGLDVVGLLTLGAGKAAQAGKAFSKGVTSIRGLSKALRFVGLTAIEAFNPAAGLGDLVVGSARLLHKGGRLGLRGVNKLTGRTASYDLLKAASQQHGVAATGTFKVAGQTLEGGAVLKEGKWYSFDADRMQAYGSPLEDFAAKSRAVDGVIATVEVAPGRELSNTLFREYRVPESNLAGRTRNSQGVYRAADGHTAHIRHIDSSGQAAVYEVREVTRTPEGVVQARIYSANRQTPLLVQHVQGDQWMRLGARGGNPPSVASDLGRMMGGGSESRLYESLDGIHVYKETREPGHVKVPDYFERQAACLNEYYGEGFAMTLFENGRGYIKMKKIDGVALDAIAPRSLPKKAQQALDEMLADLQKKEMFPNDAQLSNFMYSAKENKVYPVDFDFPPQDVLHFDESTFAIHRDDFLRDADKLRAQFRQMIA